MGALTVDQIVQAVEQLSPEERAALIERLQATHSSKPRSVLDNIPILDVGPWPEGLSLRREDMYGDDER